jgi:hypothetical protein
VALAELANSHTHSEDQQMTVALISTKPYAVIATYPTAPAAINVPGLWQQEAAPLGWTSPDGAYELADRHSFNRSIPLRTI